MKRPVTVPLLAALTLLTGCGATPAAEAVYNTTAAVTAEIAPETKPGTDTEAATLQKYVITCSELAYKSLHGSAGEKLPTTMEVTDETMLSDVLQYDMSIADDYSVYMQMISTDLFELTVIRAADDKISEVRDMLEARRTYLREQAAYYPAQVAAAESARVGEVNGICYLICSEESADIEKDLLFSILNS